MPNPDKPEQIATKAPRHKGNLQLLFIFASLRLGGENNLPYHLPKPDPPSAENKLPQRKPSVTVHLCVLVSWWRKCFATKSTKITIKRAK
jgi:hypothetical protein